MAKKSDNNFGGVVVGLNEEQIFSPATVSYYPRPIIKEELWVS